MQNWLPLTQSVSDWLLTSQCFTTRFSTLQIVLAILPNRFAISFLSLILICLLGGCNGIKHNLNKLRKLSCECCCIITYLFGWWDHWQKLWCWVLRPLVMLLEVNIPDQISIWPIRFKLGLLDLKAYCCLRFYSGFHNWRNTSTI